MGKFIKMAVLAALIGQPAMAAGTIEKACNASNRQSANRALCGCIQDVADLTLTNSDQRLAAKFFQDPQKAQDVRQSGSNSNSKFWERYRQFGSTAQAFCRA